MDVALLTPLLTVVLVPLVVAACKRAIPPAFGWTQPLLASALGVAADALAGFVGHTPLGPTWGAVLGLAGVGLREVVDQLRQQVTA